VTVLSKVVPLENATLLIVLDVLLAFEVKVKLAGAATLAFAAGLVRLTVGGVNELTLTAVDVVALPKASVAFAVMLYVPAATPVHE
jgi:hypothetical protein